MPTDPRVSVGQCGVGTPVTPLKATMTGGAGSGNIPASVRTQFPWPPATISPGLAASRLPTYTATGTIPALATQTFVKPGSQDLIGSGDGWTSEDRTPIYVPVAGCSESDHDLSELLTNGLGL